MVVAIRDNIIEIVIANLLTMTMTNEVTCMLAFTIKCGNEMSDEPAGRYCMQEKSTRGHWDP
eukprot:scaffold5711_cov115-Skeletonema_marinoi.AAC.2